MEFIIISILSIILILGIKIILDMNVKKVKKLAKNEKLDQLTNQFPENIEIAKSILKKLDNSGVIIEEMPNTKTSLYLVVNNKILIGNIRDNYTRIQTIAHECIHSVQPKNHLIFNFVYSNIYLLYFATIIILSIFHVIEQPMLYLTILILLSFIYFFIRSSLELDAMIKAKYLAKEYMQEQKSITEEQIEEVIQGYNQLNEAGIKCANFSLLLSCFWKIILYSLLVFIFL